jgi:hypothetical protein
MRSSLPLNTPRGPTMSRGRGRGLGSSFFPNRGTALYNSRGRGRGATRVFGPAQYSDRSFTPGQGATFEHFRTNIPLSEESGFGQQASAGAERGLLPIHTATSLSAESTVIATSEPPSPEARKSTPATNIPRGPAWNPPKGPRAYAMHHNQPRGYQLRVSSSSNIRYAVDTELSSLASQATEVEDEQSMKIYSVVVAGLNEGLKIKAKSSEGTEPVEYDDKASTFDEIGNKLIWMADGWLPKNSSVLAKESPETTYEQVLIPPAYTDASRIASTTSGAQLQVGFPGLVDADDPVNMVVEFVPSVDRPGWVRTTDEYMVIEFGSTGPITLRRNVTSSKSG